MTSPSQKQEAKTSKVALRLDRMVARSQIVLYCEHLWPRLWLPMGTVGLFFLLSWLGLWEILPTLGRPIGVSIFSIGFIASTIPAIAVRYPTRSEALRALDRYHSVSFLNPASALDDKAAIGQKDPVSKVLWTLHQQQAAAALSKLTIPFPHPRTADYDYYGLRGILIVALVAASCIAGSKKGERTALAFNWHFEKENAEMVSRIDGWIDPPSYTHLPPIMLDFMDMGDKKIAAPIGSLLVLRVVGNASHRINVSGKLSAKPLKKISEEAIQESQYIIEGNGILTHDIGEGIAKTFIEVVPNEPPRISFINPPQKTPRGELVITYETSHQYGITAAQGIISLPDASDEDQVLVPAPAIVLPLPRGRREQQKLSATVDLSSHPWAGAKVKFTLNARDALGQEGQSETLNLILPQRLFFNPLAMVLVEQRQKLIFKPKEYRKVAFSLHDLMDSPNISISESAIYLGLITAERMISRARHKEDFIEVADFLWEMAWQIENGYASETELAMHTAQEALRQAIRRSALPEEIAQLSQLLREAISRHLAEITRNQERSQKLASQLNSKYTKSVTQEDLAILIDRIEQMVRDGDLSGANRLSQRLSALLNNMQIAQSAPSYPAITEVWRVIRSLSEVLQKQQRLRDDTYQKGINAAKNYENTEYLEGLGALSSQQRELHDQLGNLQRTLMEQGVKSQSDLNIAKQEMHVSEDYLLKEDSESAATAQGRALEALLNGIQTLAKQMHHKHSQGEDGLQEREEQTDPLGRIISGAHPSDSEGYIPGENETPAVRARRVLDELRRRLENLQLCDEERRYLERLLKDD